MKIGRGREAERRGRIRETERYRGMEARRERQTER